MHYYPFHSGDYVRDTVHLDDAHDLAYRRLLDLYYQNEGPIPPETQRVAVRLRLGLNVVQDVLQEFFSEREDGWHQARCDEEIMRYASKAATSRRNGQKGGRRKKPSRNPAGTQQHPDSIPSATCQPPSLVMVNGSIHSLSSELDEVQFPTGFPKTASQAREMAQQVGCPAPPEYLEEIWDQARSRGGRDGADVPIRVWGSHAKKRWTKEEMEWTAKRRKQAALHIPQYPMDDGERELTPWELLQQREREAENAG